MKKLISELNSDHELIENKLEVLAQILSEPEFKNNLSKIKEALIFFETFTFKEHHRREEDILYKWMLEQNKDSDRELINKIISEHRFLEEIANNLKKEVEFAIKNNDNKLGKIGADLSYFVTAYTEHAERESSFIFVIAETLNKSGKI
jgi:hemerythrin-like domain-containing protein